MKKFTLFVFSALLLFNNSVLLSQNKSTQEILFFDGFNDSGWPPEGWEWINENELINWEIQSTNHSQGTSSPELMFVWYPDFSGSTGIKSPAISTVGQASVYLSFNLLRGWYETFGGYHFYIETTSDGGATWNEVWVGENPEAFVDPEEIAIFIDNDDVGSDQFQFAVRFDGETSYLDAWFFDDFELSVSELNDMEATEIILPKLLSVGESLYPQAVITNVGSGTVSFDVNFELLFDGITSVYNETLTIADFAPNQIDTVYFPNWTPTHGNYESRLAIQLDGDGDPDNNQLFDTITIINSPTLRKITLELFTSSTCGPCVDGNTYLDWLVAQYPNTYSLVKYQMNWPYTGDPYYTPEGGVRRSYYNVSGVPDLFMNSISYFPDDGDISTELFESHFNDISPIELEIESALINDENQVMISVNITPLIDYPSELTAHIVVVEKETTGNVGSNGETEFSQVMMKMLPNANGTLLNNLQEGVVTNIYETFDMDETFMEESHDLEVVVFIQDDGDKYMIQTENKEIGTNVGTSEVGISRLSTIFPNPTNDRLNINCNNVIDNIQLVNSLGQVLFEDKPSDDELVINVSDFEHGIYFLRIRNGSNVEIRKVVID